MYRYLRDSQIGFKAILRTYWSEMKIQKFQLTAWVIRYYLEN